MNMKRIFIAFLALFFAVAAVAQPPANYYNSANGLTGDQLKAALHDIVKNHSSISYKAIWGAFYSTDKKPNTNNVVWDMYSDRPGGTPPYTFYLGTSQCGSYSGEGDCYNREHSWPESWFNSDETARTDLHHIFATDGYVNNRRGNYAFGEVQNASWTSQNGSKLGSCKPSLGFSGTVFEPIDEYKGDFARAIMYMSVRYYGEDSSWGNSDMTTKSVIKPWAITMLLRWNKQDPVSQKEINRNNVIYNNYQHNRNPFVDHPEYADMIWDPTWTDVDEFQDSDIAVFPNPVCRGGEVSFDFGQQQVDQVTLCDISGRILLKIDIYNDVRTIFALPSNIRSGFYFLQIYQGGRIVMNSKLLII